jgi:hypothetical protein
MEGRKKMLANNIHDHAFSSFVPCSVLLAATVISSLGNIQFKLDAKMREHNALCVWYERRHFILGMVLSVCGGAADILVIGSIPFVLRCCFSGLSIPISVLIGQILLSEEIDDFQLLGIPMATLGSVCSIFSVGDATTKTSLVSMSFPTLLLGSFICAPLFIRGLNELRNPLPSSNRMRSLCLCACTVAFVATCSTLTARLTSHAVSAWFGVFHLNSLGLGLVCIAVSLLQMSLLATLMSKFTITESVTTYQIFNSAWLVIFSAVFFTEYPDHPVWFALSLLLNVGGIALTQNRTRSVDHKPMGVVTKKRSM